MRTVPANITSHLASGVTSLTLLVKVIRKDGQVFAFTMLDEDIRFGEYTYKAVNAVTPTKFSFSSDLSADNAEIEVLIGGLVSSTDIYAGLFDNAIFEVSLVNFQSTALESVLLFSGRAGAISPKKGAIRAEVLSKKRAFQNQVGRFFGRKCDANLGDSRCTVNLTSYTVTGTVTSVTDNRVFVVSSAPAASGGVITWTSGNNSGKQMEIYSKSGSELTLFLPMPGTVQVGDAYSATPGCDKTRPTCRDTYNNIVNFRGFPDIPGPDAVLQYPDAQ